MHPGLVDAAVPVNGFRHEAFLYAGEQQFLEGTVEFILAGIDAGDPLLVALSADKIDALRIELGRAASAVQFLDMTDLGQNPARIIPAWREFVDWGPAAGRRRRGVGEPIWRSRSEVELIECQRHESLLNVAFDDGPAWWLLCPYDTDTLAEEILAEARRSHRLLLVDGSHQEGDLPTAAELAVVHLNAPLPEPPEPVDSVPNLDGDLRDVREYVAVHAIASGMQTARAFDLLVAVSEVATNSIRHGGGAGQMRVWHDQESVVCEFADRGVVTNPLVGRTKPDVSDEGHRGLWMANQLCDLVQLRVFKTGTVVRLHMRVSGG